MVQLQLTWRSGGCTDRRVQNHASPYLTEHLQHYASRRAKIAHEKAKDLETVSACGRESDRDSVLGLVVLEPFASLIEYDKDKLERVFLVQADYQLGRTVDLPAEEGRFSTRNTPQHR